MAKYYKISVQGFDKDLISANGSFNSIDFDKLTEERVLDILEKLTNIKNNLDCSGKDLCQPSFIIIYGKEEPESFLIENHLIKYSETGKEVTAEEVLKISRKEIAYDKRLLRAENLEKNNFFPIRKRHILPTDTESIKAEDIDTSDNSPQFGHTIWRSRNWLEASHTAPFAIGGFFALIGLVVLGEKRDAEMAPIMFLIAVICFLTFFPWRTLAKTKIKCGIDWTTNTLWIKKKKVVVGFQPDANYIEDIVFMRNDKLKINPIWLVNPSTPIVFRKKQQILQTKHVYSEHLWIFPGAVFSTKKESGQIAEKFNQLLKNQS